MPLTTFVLPLFSSCLSVPFPFLISQFIKLRDTSNVANPYARLPDLLSFHHHHHYSQPPTATYILNRPQCSVCGIGL